MEEGWARALCANLAHRLKQLAAFLAPDVQQSLVLALLPRLLSRIERPLATRKFNMLGGLMLDRCARSGPRCLKIE